MDVCVCECVLLDAMSCCLVLCQLIVYAGNPLNIPVQRLFDSLPNSTTHVSCQQCGLTGALTSIRGQAYQLMDLPNNNITSDKAHYHAQNREPTHAEKDTSTSHVTARLLVGYAHACADVCADVVCSLCLVCVVCLCIAAVPCPTLCRLCPRCLCCRSPTP